MCVSTHLVDGARGIALIEWIVIFVIVSSTLIALSALTLLVGGRKGIRPVKNWVVGCWHGCLSGARCRLVYGPADATATHCLLLRSRFFLLFWYRLWMGVSGWMFLLVPAYPGCPGSKAVKRSLLLLLLLFWYRLTRVVPEKGPWIFVLHCPNACACLFSFSTCCWHHQ